MPPIEVGATRAIGAVSAELTRKASTDATSASTASSQAAASASATLAASSTAGATVTTSAALDAGDAPVDTDRVSQIRKAIETGSYPLVPAKIADAMIAAGMILRSGKA